MSSETRTQKRTTESIHEQQLVVFKVAGEEFGVNINEVKEIIRWENVTRIPNSAPYTVSGYVSAALRAARQFKTPTRSDRPLPLSPVLLRVTL